MSRTVHVVGAGLAGLACALHLARKDVSVTVYEASPQAGGRCRSWHDPVLDRVIDNGTHLILRGNTALRRYLRLAGVRPQHALCPAVGPEGKPVPPFTMLRSQGNAETLRPGWRGLHQEGQGWHGMLAPVLKLALAAKHQRVADVVGQSPLYPLFWAPLCLAIMNTKPEHAQARLLGRTLMLALSQGMGGLMPLLAQESLDATFVSPAVAALRAAGGTVRFGTRITALEDERLILRDGIVLLRPEDRVVLAVPQTVATGLLPDLGPPWPTHSILNVHIRLSEDMAPLPNHGMAGALDTAPQWLFRRSDVLAATISDAGDEMPEAVRHDMESVLNLDLAGTPWRAVREQRATLAHTPAVQTMRQALRWNRGRVILAGDWTFAALPCTLETAVRSGFRAAKAYLSAK